MRLPLFADSLDLRAVPGADPAGLAKHTGFGGGRGLADASHVCPLLDGLLKVMEVEGFIIGSVPQLHSRTSAGVPRVRVPDQVTPLRRGFGRLTTRTGAVPCTRARKAGEGDTSKGRTGLEDVWVGADQDVGHHAAGAVASDEDTVGIRGIPSNGIANHVADREGVTAAIVLEGVYGSYVPTAAGDDGVWVAIVASQSVGRSVNQSVSILEHT